MQHAELSKQKERRVTGGSVNYYLQSIPGSDDKSDVVVEAEDIIEHTEMNFAAGCTFKAVWRICKLRQDLGKPGSTIVYEAEKDVYYSARTVVATLRRELRLNTVTHILRSLKFIIFYGYDEFVCPGYINLNIPDPKRLDPYCFVIDDLTAALGATENESIVITNIIAISLMRKKHRWLLHPNELNLAEEMLERAKVIEQREKIIGS